MDNSLLDFDEIAKDDDFKNHLAPKWKRFVNLLIDVYGIQIAFRVFYELNIDEKLSKRVNKPKTATNTVKTQIPNKSDYNMMADVFHLPKDNKGYSGVYGDDHVCDYAKQLLTQFFPRVNKENIYWVNRK